MKLHIYRIASLMIVVVSLFVLTGSTYVAEAQPPVQIERVEPSPEPVRASVTVSKPEVRVSTEPMPEPLPEPVETPKMDVAKPYYEAARYIAKTVYGEARGLPVTDQAAVIWCILNRTDQRETQTPEDVIKVVTARGQFHGYRKGNPVRDEHYELALDVIRRWIYEKAGASDVGRVLPREYTFFAAKNGRNRFRDAYRSRNYWDWSLPSPYEDIEE